MAITSAWFRSGKVSITKNQTIVQGFSTAWINHLTPIGVGDAFTTDFSVFYEVVEVLSDTQIKLDRAYAGTSGSKVPYAMVRNGSSNFSVRTAAAVQKSLAWYQEQLALTEKMLTEDGDVIVELPDGTKLTLWSEKKKQRIFTEKMADLEVFKTSIIDQLPTVENSVLEALSGGWVVNRKDANGNWNLMFRLPKFTNEMVNNKLGTTWEPAHDVHPAFKRPDGTIRNNIETALYLGSNDGKGNIVSREGKDPYTNLNFDQITAKCEAMGDGWGLQSNAEWAALTIYALCNGFQPNGNTYYGRSHSDFWQAGIRQDSGLPGDAAGTARTLTGSGPIAWRLLNTLLSPADMVGNVWEWVTGLKLTEGQIVVDTKNGSMESAWIAQKAYLDSGNKLNSQKTANTSTNVEWRSVSKDTSYVSNQLLQQLLIEPITGTNEALGRLYYNNEGERLPIRGANWYYGSSAGLAALSLYNPRSNASSYIGGRPAYRP